MEVTHVRISPDWSILFVDGEVELSSHSLDVGRALDSVKDVDYDTVESVHLSQGDVAGRDCPIDEYVREMLFG